MTKTGRFSKGAGDKVALVRMVEKGSAGQAADLLERIVSEALVILRGRKLTAAEAAAQALATPRIAGLADAYRQAGGRLTEASLGRILADRLGSGTKPGPTVEVVVEPDACTLSRTCKSGDQIRKTLADLRALHDVAEELAKSAGWRAAYAPFNAAADRIRAGVPLEDAVAQMKAAVRT